MPLIMCETKGHNGHNYCPDCMAHNADKDHECPPFLAMLVKMNREKAMMEQFPPLVNNSKRPLEKNVFLPGRITPFFSPWEKIRDMMIYAFMMALVGALLFGIKMHYEFQARDISCKAKAYDQLQEVIQVVKKAQS